jgi:hypothetical protein
LIGAASSMFPSGAKQVTSDDRNGDGHLLSGASSATDAGAKLPWGTPRAVKQPGWPVSCGTTRRGNQGRLEIAAIGGADRRSAKNAAAPINQSREAHRSARPYHSPEGAISHA